MVPPRLPLQFAGGEVLLVCPLLIVEDEEQRVRVELLEQVRLLECRRRLAREGCRSPIGVSRGIPDHVHNQRKNNVGQWRRETVLLSSSDGKAHDLPYFRALHEIQVKLQPSAVEVTPCLEAVVSVQFLPITSSLPISGTHACHNIISGFTSGHVEAVAPCELLTVSLEQSPLAAAQTSCSFPKLPDHLPRRSAAPFPKPNDVAQMEQRVAHLLCG